MVIVSRSPKNEFILQTCDACNKPIFYRNFPEDDTLLCLECFEKWDGTYSGKGYIDCRIEIKK